MHRKCEAAGEADLRHFLHVNTIVRQRGANGAQEAHRRFLPRQAFGESGAHTGEFLVAEFLIVWSRAIMRRQFREQSAQHGRGIAHQRAGRTAEAIDLLGVDVEPHDRQMSSSTPQMLCCQ